MTQAEKKEILLNLYINGEIDKEDFYELLKKICK